MLKLRRAVVVETGDAHGPEQRLTTEVQGQRREAIAEVSLVGRAQVGDELLVNVQALDMGLGSGGFDIVHANLARGLDAEEVCDGGVMKLNYTSLQHAVAPVDDAQADVPVRRPVGVLALHGQLAAVAWAFASAAPGKALGYVQTVGGALPGGHSQTVRALRERGLLAGHLTAGSAFGGDQEAITTAGGLPPRGGVLRMGAPLCGPRAGGL